jgi:hypothetical protein
VTCGYGKGLTAWRSGRSSSRKRTILIRTLTIGWPGTRPGGKQGYFDVEPDNGQRVDRTNLYYDIQKGVTDVHVGELVESLRRLREIMRDL